MTSDADLRRRLADTYLRGHAREVSGAMYADVRTTWPHYEVNYASIVAALPAGAAVLEIGPGHGGMLAWLRSKGVTDVRGVDTSPGDVAFANEMLGAGTVVEAAALDFLRTHDDAYDAVVAKAVLEHVPRAELLALLEAAASRLRPGGVLVVEVPNMDWLLASHERYMDLTHETGFTRESLAALLRLCFDEVEVRGSALAEPTRAQRLLRPLLLGILRRGLYVLGEGASDLLFAHRSLIATARSPRR